MVLLGLITDIIQVGFYRSFGRPIAKTFFGAVFTYQVIYFVWVKLDVDEMKAKKSGISSPTELGFLYQYTHRLIGALGTLRSLEATVQELVK